MGKITDNSHNNEVRKLLPTVKAGIHDESTSQLKKASELRPGDVIKVPNNLITNLHFGGNFDIEAPVYNVFSPKHGKFTILFQGDCQHVSGVKADTEFEFVRSESSRSDDFGELVKAVALKKPNRSFWNRVFRTGD